MHPFINIDYVRHVPNYTRAHDVDSVDVEQLDRDTFLRQSYRYGVRSRAGGETVRSSGKLMRILQRQPDASWKIHRGIITADPPTP